MNVRALRTRAYNNDTKDKNNYGKKRNQTTQRNASKDSRG